MASTILDSHSNRNKTPPKFHGFHTFAEPGCPITLTGAFRDNIRRFLQECAGLEDYDLDGMLIWRTFLVYESKGTVLPLYTVEENVERSDRPFCDYCRCVGKPLFFIFLKSELGLVFFFFGQFLVLLDICGFLVHQCRVEPSFRIEKEVPFDNSGE